MRFVVCTVTGLIAVSSLAGAGIVSPAHAQASGGGSTAVATSFVASSLPADDRNALRAATEKFADVNAALAAGYIRDPSGMCVNAATEGAPRQLGAMGVHYFRPDLLGLAGEKPRVHGTGMHMDFLQPAVLIYEPQSDGSHQLVAIENLVWANAWQEAGNTGAPSYAGNDYFYMHDNPETAVDEAHGFEPHYELHLWLYRDNPNGTFAPFNPAVTCAHNQSGAGHP